MSGLNSKAILTECQGRAQGLGLFEQAAKAEPMSAGQGLRCASFVDRVRAVPLSSGLASTTALVVILQRIYLPIGASLPDSRETIDETVLDAADRLMAAYSGGFEFDVSGANIELDLLGRSGFALESMAGFVEVSKVLHRCMTVQVPVLVYDAWTQEA